MLDLINTRDHNFRVRDEFFRIHLFVIFNIGKNMLHAIYSGLFLVVRPNDRPRSKGAVRLIEHLEFFNAVLIPELLGQIIHWRQLILLEEVMFA